MPALAPPSSCRLSMSPPCGLDSALLLGADSGAVKAEIALRFSPLVNIRSEFGRIAEN
jgi:hypothetical protein